MTTVGNGPTALLDEVGHSLLPAPDLCCRLSLEN